MSLLVQIALTFGILSLLSIGGANATIPEIHRQVIDVHHWMDDSTFASLVAIGQTAPGPNVLIVGAIGWQLAGIAGLLAASVAIVFPSSLLALTIGRAMARHASVGAIEVVRNALAPIALGFMLASGWVMTRAAYVGAPTFLIVGGVALLVLVTRVSPFWGVVAGAAVGIVGHRFHLFG